MIRNVLFDWSGTLVDDLPAVWEATNYVFRQAGLEPLTLERFRAEFCLPFKKFYDRFTPNLSMAQLEEWFHGAFRKAQTSVVEIPHARSFLEHCQQRGLRLFVLSTVHPEYFQAQAKTLQFNSYFERSYVGIMDKEAKIKELLHENQLLPDETLFIGDMQHDIDAARHGGVFSAAVLTGYSGVQQLRASRPHLIVEHLGELQRLLEQSRWEFHATAPARLQAEGACPVVTVGALIFDRSGQVLMIRTHKWSSLWGIPGGKVRFGEASLDALRREVNEETALDLGDIEFVMVQDCIHSTEFYRDAHFVLLNYTGRVEGNASVRLNEEAQEFCWTTPEAALQLALNQPTRRLLQAVMNKPPR
jgi:phosphoglycolate phosphatase-like HAD superfamily hydrolase/ADP-ribose pyrophosphatase YjhB (NUDIX family)